MTEAQWIVLYAVTSGLFGRLVKLVPSIPKGLLPWLVMLAGYGISFGMGIQGGMSAADAAVAAWCGLAGGMLAVGGHEALKPLLGRVMGEKNATKLLGKLPAPKKGGSK